MFLPLLSKVFILLLFVPLLSASLELGSSHSLHDVAQSVRLLKHGKNLNLQKIVDHFNHGVYVLDIAIGTPQPFRAIIDTGSDLIWTQCKEYRPCVPQFEPLFDPQSSSSFTNLSYSHDICNVRCNDLECIYRFQYGDGTTTVGILGTETFTFGSDVTQFQIAEVAFGCGMANVGTLANSSGILGLGRGPLSLVSQLKLRRFSHCFSYSNVDASFADASFIFFGSSAKLEGGSIHSTPLLRSPRASPTFYYLSLEGITIGEMLLSIPSSTFELKEDGSGGTIIDSGTTALYLHEVAYSQVSKAFVSQLGMEFVNGTNIVGAELCFKPSQYHDKSLPNLILHLKGTDWKLHADNYLEYIKKVDLFCSVVKRAVDGRLTIIGNYAMQNMHVLYNLKKERLSFVTTICSQL